MFFRREKPRTLTFSNHLASLRNAGFTVTPSPAGGKAMAAKNGCSVEVTDAGAGAVPLVSDCGWVIGGQPATLIDAGYQKFWRTAAGKQLPARALELHALHEFQEDLKEALGLESLYNESLGSTSGAHLYDRVKDRDRGVPARPWE